MFSGKPEFKKRILFIGIPDMAYVCMDGLLAAGVNIVGVMGPKKDHSSYFPFKEFVETKRLNYILYDELDEPQLIQTIKDLNVDVAVVSSFNYKLPKVFLDAPKDGVINIHPSLLPKYRGGNPYSTVLINGENETGVTLHFMDENFDTGDIIIQQKVPIVEKETMGTLFNRLNYLGMELLVMTLREYEKRVLPRRPQPKGEYILGKGIKEHELFIDYSKSAENIERFIRALNPFILASTYFRSNFVKILAAEVVKDDAIKERRFGEIVKIDDERVYVATGDGFLAITALQFGTYLVGPCKNFIKLLKPEIGEVFG